MGDASVRKYIIRETGIATLFNTAFSFGFAYLFFKGLEEIPQNTLIVDAIPQSFAVTLFGVLVPSLMTRAKIRAGKLEPLPARKFLLPANLFLRVVTMAAIAAAAGALLHFIVLGALQVDQLAHRTALIYKPVYGALLTWIVTPVGLLALLRQPKEEP